MLWYQLRSAYSFRAGTGLAIFAACVGNIGAPKKDPPLRRARDARERNRSVSPGGKRCRVSTRYVRLGQPLLI
jgi:hypothetical protein